MLQNGRHLIQRTAIPDIYTNSHLADIASGCMGKLRKFRKQSNGKIIHTKVSHILQHFQGCGFSGS